MAGVAVIEFEEGAFVSARHSCDQFTFVRAGHRVILPKKQGLVTGRGFPKSKTVSGGVLRDVNQIQPNRRNKVMKKAFLVTLVMVLALSAFSAAGGVSKASADESKLLEFNSMIGLPRPYTGAANAIRGVPGGGLPWVVEFGKGKVSPEGKVDVKVKGLVFDPNDQAVIDRGLAGINTVPNFKAIISCLSKDANGNAVTVNVSTGLFPADSAGNAHIKDTVVLPQPCIAPILFVTSPTGAWFAATGY
jgi:hypothetical protein